MTGLDPMYGRGFCQWQVLITLTVPTGLGGHCPLLVDGCRTAVRHGLVLDPSHLNSRERTRWLSQTDPGISVTKTES